MMPRQTAVVANRKRDYFVRQEEARKVLDACPNAQWRLTFALARYGGLRCPSELVRLRWDEVNWAEGKMLVHSPKTEHHPNGESRWVPIFPELQPLLTEVFEQAEPGTEYVITQCRSSEANLRTHMLRIIHRAGLIRGPSFSRTFAPPERPS
jgi:integrase